TVGEDEFRQANVLLGRGQTNEAIAAFERLREVYPATWIDRRSEERLAKLKPRETGAPTSSSARTGVGARAEQELGSPAQGQADGRAKAQGLAAKYPGDVGITNDPDVFFADNFESGDMKKWDQKRGRVVMTEDKPNSGRWCVQMPMERGKNQGG